METIQSSQEIEQRHIVNPHLGLYLPKNYLEYHQAEIGSGKAGRVIEKFYARTQDIFSEIHTDSLTIIQSLLGRMDTEKQIKLRIRKIFDPKTGETKAEFTAKEKTDDPDFKIYREHNINIDPTLAINLIEHVAPRHIISNEVSEFGVRKLRYNVPGPDGMFWDLDVLQGLNAGLCIGEIEVATKDTPIILPPWAVRRVNGDPNFKFLGTKDLQKTPWLLLSIEKRNAYIAVLNAPILPSVV